MPLRESIAKDFWLKMFSLALATLIWFTVKFAIRNEMNVARTALAPTTQRVFEKLPITVMTAAGESRGFKVEPESVKVVVSGEAVALQILKERDIEVYVNLTDVQDAKGLRKRIEVYTPPGVGLVRVVPPDVSVEKMSSPDENSQSGNR
ncbi:MAG TPA: CdaR family protein [Candidatus Eisenbacteria bacterium]|nr:CdaR family protein [Candidatus Eisenbacteria bacterium]